MKTKQVTPEAFAAYQKEMAQIEAEYTKALQAADQAYLKAATMAERVCIMMCKRPI